MSSNIVENVAGAAPAAPERPPDPLVKPPEPGFTTAHILRYRKLQEEAEAREKKLLAELEAKQDAFCKRLEESFAQKEKLLIEDLQARHMAECRRLELAAADREHSLIVQLAVARRRLALVIIIAVLAVVATLNFRSASRAVSAPAPGASGEAVVSALLPHLSSAQSIWAMPVAVNDGQSSPEAAATVKQEGNGGIFPRGYSSGN